MEGEKMKDYLMLIAAAILMAANFGLNKLYQKKAGTSLCAGLGFNAILGLMTAIIFWIMGGFQIHLSLYSVLMATALATIGMIYTLLGFRILRSGSMALYTLFLMTGGMALPYIWGLLFLDEPFAWLRMLGLAVLILAVAFSNLGGNKGKTNVALLSMCVAVFVLNGLLSVLSKLHQIQTELTTVSTTEFVMLCGFFKFLLAGIAFLFARRQESKKDTATPTARLAVLRLLPLILIAAITDGASYALQLTGASNLPATVLYPFVTGGSMVFSTIVGVIFFREKPSKNLVISVCLCFAGTLMFL